MTERGEQIRARLEALEVEAHLSGLDVLAVWSNQIYLAYPHLVVTSRAHASTVEFELSQLGLACARDWRQPPLQNLDELLIIAAVGSYDQQPLLALASHQQAWIETYQAVASGVYPLAPSELGQMLLLAGGTDEVFDQPLLLEAAPDVLKEELEQLFAGAPQTEMASRVLSGWRAAY